MTKQPSARRHAMLYPQRIDRPYTQASCDDNEQCTLPKEAQCQVSHQCRSFQVAQQW